MSNEVSKLIEFLDTCVIPARKWTNKSLSGFGKIRGILEKSKSIEKSTIARGELLGWIAQGWCSILNEHKIMDPDLADGIANAIIQNIKKKGILVEK